MGDTRIKAYGHHVLLLRLAEENKGVGLFIPDAYEDDSILWGRVRSIGDLAKKALPEIETGDVILFKRDSALGRATTYHDFDTFLVNVVDCLAYQRDEYGRRYARENYL